MIGKSHWFQRRKYLGWGLQPKTWQGWAYVGVFVGIVMLIQYLPIGDDQSKIIATMVLALILVLDVIHMMISMPMDERDRIHEAKAERNALWVIMAVLATGIGWQAAQSAINNSMQVDPVILIAMFSGLAAKAITNLYLDRTD